MKIQSHTFGAVEVKEDMVLRFPDGIIGFEELKRYVILEVEEYGPFRILLSLDDPEVGFPLIDPALFFPDYTPNIPPSDLKRLSLPSMDEGRIFCIVTLRKPEESSTVNLRGPIVIHPETRIARQTILTQAAYPVDQPIINEQ
ncbi:MAG: hypothetical protein B1H02_03360 [Candidatus Latescibacteria bacterium 4484_107]|nr:MAG: hypothetical protein B1H02_03360 [Candidatus Latescibacteria bacterium 4484_107]